MPTYYIVKYSSNNSKPRIVAFTHSIETARELCSMDETRRAGKWFYGFTENPPVKPSKAGCPSAGDLIKAIHAKSN